MVYLSTIHSLYQILCEVVCSSDEKWLELLLFDRPLRQKNTFLVTTWHKSIRKAVSEQNMEWWGRELTRHSNGKKENFSFLPPKKSQTNECKKKGEICWVLNVCLTGYLVVKKAMDYWTGKILIGVLLVCFNIYSRKLRQSEFSKYQQLNCCNTVRKSWLKWVICQ